MRTLLPLLKASIIATAVFVLGWTRINRGPSGPMTLFLWFILFNIPIGVVSLIIGWPIAALVARYRMVHWGLCTGLGAFVGAGVTGSLTYNPLPGPGVPENPMPLSLSPWQSDSQFIESGFTSPDFLGSVAFGAIVGAVLGLAFWFFYSRAMPAEPADS